MDGVAPIQAAPGARGSFLAPRPETLVGLAGLAAFLAASLLPPAFLAAAWIGRAASDPARVLGWAVPSPRTLSLLGNSLLLAASAALLATVLGLALAVWMHEGDTPRHRLVRRVYMVPLLIPPYLHALAWMSLAGRRQALEQTLGILLGPDRISVSAYGFLPAVVVLGLALAPIVTLFAAAGLEAVQPELMQQALVQAPAWRAARRVALPLIAPWVVAAAGLVFVLAALEYGVPSVLQFNVYAMEIYAAFSQDSDPVHALASSAPVVAAAVAVLAASQALLSSNPLRGTPSGRPPLWLEAWPWPPRWLARTAAVLAGVAVAGAPAVLLVRAGTSPAAWAGVGAALGEVGRTIATAALAATGSALIALPAAALLARTRAAGGLLWALAALPLAIPSPLTGIALIHLGNQPWLDWGQSSILPLVWAHVARLLPFALFAASTQVRRIDPVLMDALSLHRTGPWRGLWIVRLPLLAPALATSWLVVFVLSLGELGATLLVAPPGQGTLPLRIYNLMHYGASETVAALSLVILAAAGAAALAVANLGRRLWPWTL